MGVVFLALSIKGRESLLAAIALVMEGRPPFLVSSLGSAVPSKPTSFLKLFDTSRLILTSFKMLLYAPALGETLSSFSRDWDTS